MHQAFALKNFTLILRSLLQHFHDIYDILVLFLIF